MVEAHAKLHETDADYHDTMFKTFRAMADAAEPDRRVRHTMLFSPSRRDEPRVVMSTIGKVGRRFGNRHATSYGSSKNAARA
jgi:hypothetical protein